MSKAVRWRALIPWGCVLALCAALYAYIQLDKPHIEYFTASPAEIDPGGSVTLKWKASGDSFALVTIDDGAGHNFHSSGVAGEGSTTVTVEPWRRDSMTYFFYAEGVGKTVISEARVKIGCPDAWFFPNPPLNCPDGPATITDAVSQSFENGRMLWFDVRGYSSRINVLYGRGFSHPYDSKWTPGMPESDLLITPPAGLYQPVGRFGLLWRQDPVDGSGELRPQIGWATEPEVSFRTAYQCSTGGKYTSCYFRDLPGETIFIGAEISVWSIWYGSATPVAP